MGNDGSKVDWPVSYSGVDRQRTDGGELPRIEGCCGAVAKGQLYVFGGGNVNEQSNELLRFSPASQSHSVVPAGDGSSVAPRARTGGCLVYLAAADALLLFGGMADGEWLNDTHLFHLATATWQRVQQPPAAAAPCPRDKATLVALDGGRALLFGGFGPLQRVSDDDDEAIKEQDDSEEKDENSQDNDDDDEEQADDDDDNDDEAPSVSFQWFADVWCFNADKQSWQQISTSGMQPEGRAAATSCLLRNADGVPCVYIFGGREPAGRTNELLELSTADWSWSTREAPAGQLPSKRSFHVAAAVSDHRMVVWGGRDADEADLDDLHVYDSLVNVWVQPAAAADAATLPARGFAAAGYAPPKLYIFAGSANHKPDAEPVFFADLLAIDLSPIVDGPPIVKPEPPAADFS